jgi:hypothetical protein
MNRALKYLVLAVFVPLVGCGDSNPNAVGGPVAMRRLTAEQYRNAIEDTFGNAVEVAGRFEPDSRRDGLNAIGAAMVAVTPSGFEQYESIARSVAAQVTSPELRDDILPCQPAATTAPDDACTDQIVRKYSRLLLRRPVGEDEIQMRVALAAATTEQNQNYYAGLELALSSLLVAPEFLFRVEIAAPAPTADQPNRLQLSAASLASRLSYLFWNRGPDEALLTAAENGELSQPEGLTRQIDRLLASENLAQGVSAFFEDLFLFDQFDNLGKDVARYPLYNVRMAADAREQTMRFVVDQLVTQSGDFRQLFTSRALPMTRSLGPVYGLPVRAVEGWEDMQLPANNPRAGLLSQASFAMLFSHPGRSSATLRGVFMRESLLCQTIPEAPADVDFTQFSQDVATEHQTARDRLEVHSTQASCRKCHILTDPIGLGLEVYDGIGRYRTAENGAPIDTVGDFDGTAFANPAELGQAFADNPVVSACMVQNLYRYAVGRKQTNPERQLLRHLETQFANNGYQVPALMREIATSEAFRTASEAATQPEPKIESATKAPQVTDTATAVSRSESS